MSLSKFTLSSLAAAVSLIPLAGCGGGKGATVSGTATFNSQSIERGYVNFYPEDGKSPAAGGDISGGRFSVSNVSPGKNKVVVSSMPTTEAPSSMGDPKKPNTASKVGVVMSNDEGNGKVYDIPPGGTELTLDLKTTSSSGPPLKK